MFSGAEYACNPEPFQKHMVIEQLVAFSSATVFEQVNVWCIVADGLITRLCSRVVAEIDPSSLAPAAGFSRTIWACGAAGSESTVCRWTCRFIHVMMLELQSSLNARANRTVESGCVEEQRKKSGKRSQVLFWLSLAHRGQFNSVWRSYLKRSYPKARGRVEPVSFSHSSHSQGWWKGSHCILPFGCILLRAVGSFALSFFGDQPFAGSRLPAELRVLIAYSCVLLDIGFKHTEVI